MEEVVHNQMMICKFSLSLVFFSFVPITLIGRPVDHQRNRSTNEVLITSVAGADKASFP